jgi:hypothetical protein
MVLCLIDLNKDIALKAMNTPVTKNVANKVLDSIKKTLTMKTKMLEIICKVDQFLNGMTFDIMVSSVFKIRLL